MYYILLQSVIHYIHKYIHQLINALINKNRQLQTAKARAVERYNWKKN